MRVSECLKNSERSAKEAQRAQNGMCARPRARCMRGVIWRYRRKIVFDAEGVMVRENRKRSQRYGVRLREAKEKTCKSDAEA